MKKCCTCKELKPKSEFYADKRTSDGLKYQCKRCHGITSVQSRNLERHRTVNREFMRKARAKDPDKFRARERSFCRRKDIRVQARAVVNNAVKNGQLKRPNNCQECGREKRLTAHHNDYNKPLEVRWLCYECHGKYHRKIS